MYYFKNILYLKIVNNRTIVDSLDKGQYYQEKKM